MRIGVIIQGPIGDLYVLQKNIQSLTKIIDPKDIIISTWESSRESIKPLGDIGVNIIFSKKSDAESYLKNFDSLNKSNSVLQTCSFLIGARTLTSMKSYDYLIKLRTDEFYKDWTKLISNIQEDDRINSCNIFWRKDVPFHIGDHLIAGRSDLILNMVESCWHDIVENSNFFNKYVQHVDSRKWARIFSSKEEDDLQFVNKVVYNVICPEIRYSTAFLRNETESEISVKDHKHLVSKYFRPIAAEDFKEFYTFSKSLNINLDKDNFHSYEDVILDKNGIHACNECHERVLCAKRRNQAAKLALVRNIIRSEDEIVDLPDNKKNILNMFCPWVVLPEFKNLIDIDII